MTAPEDASPLAFPCDFPIKVMGRKEPRFAQTIMDIVLRHAATHDVMELILERDPTK